MGQTMPGRLTGLLFRGLVLCASLLGLTAVQAAPKVAIDTPQDKAVVSSEKIDIKGIAAAVGGGAGIDLMLVVDDSGSLGGTDPRKLRFQAIQALLNELAKGSNVHVGLVFFSGAAQTDVPLMKIADAVKPINDAIAKRQNPYGATNIGGGIRNAQNEFKARGRQDAARIVLLFTDGEHNTGLPPEPEAAAVKTAGGLVNVVGLGLSPYGKTAAEKIAQQGGGQLLAADKPEMLVELFKSSKIVGIERLTITNLTNKKTVPAALATGIYTGSDLPLELGENKIEVVAFDTTGGSAKAEVTVTRHSTATDSTATDPCDSGVAYLQVVGDPALIGKDVTQYQVQAVFNNGQKQTVDATWHDAEQQVIGGGSADGETGFMEQKQGDSFEVIKPGTQLCGKTVEAPISITELDPVAHNPKKPATEPGSSCFDAGSPDYGFQIQGTRQKAANDSVQVEMCTVNLGQQKVDVYIAIDVPEVGLVFVNSTGAQVYGAPDFSPLMTPYARNVQLQANGNILSLPNLGSVLGTLYGRYVFYVLLVTPGAQDILNPAHQVAPLRQSELVYIRTY